ncbi:hypothetical protein ACFY0F_39050, partial [Streptomyces sp. NPDC001544]|uniref:hypothetical protein n=1 Tax=Streptomyces sp. NPDC001544 TaxID=3364584 RepID=UPI0036C24466
MGATGLTFFQAVGVERRLRLSHSNMHRTGQQLVALRNQGLFVPLPSGAACRAPLRRKLPRLRTLVFDDTRATEGHVIPAPVVANGSAP